MLFSQIIGQKKIKERLLQSVNEQRIPHAQMLCGPEGIGKFALALAYAQYICCENKTETDACGVCPSCIKYQKLTHPDLHLVFPIIKQEKKKLVVCDDYVAQFRKMVLDNPYFSENEWYAKIGSENKQGMIYTSESEEIIRKLNLKTYEAEYKVMIIWLPERMNLETANKLLKILEEPPEKTVFLLVSNSPDKIIPTILSRTQQIQIPRLNKEEIIEALIKNEHIAEEEAFNIAQISEGSYLKALSYLNEDDINKQNFEHFVKIMRLTWKLGNKKDYAALKSLKNWAEEMATTSNGGRERQKNFLTYAQRMIRENFIFNLNEPALNYMTSFEKDFSSGFSPFINERNVEELMNEFALAENHIERNVNPKMVFFDLLMKVVMLLKK